jgi:hypothetical protein
MGNPETKATLDYEKVQRQANELKTLKIERWAWTPYKKLANVGQNRCFTSTFLDIFSLIFVFKHSIIYEINKIKNARILYSWEFY